MAIEALHHFHPEDNNETEQKAPIIPIFINTLEELSPSKTAEQNEQAIQLKIQEEKEALMKRYRDLCIDPAMPQADAWRFMQELLALQFEQSFHQSDPQQERSSLTPGDYANSFFSRYRRGYVELVSALNNHSLPTGKRNEQLKAAQVKMILARKNTQQFYSEETNKTHAKYLDSIEKTFAHSPYLDKLKSKRKKL